MDAQFLSLVIAPLALTLAVLGTFAWRREMERREIEAAARMPLPDGSVALATPAALAPRRRARARMLVVLVGTMAENVGKRWFTMLNDCGLADKAGAVLLIELDGARTDDFEAGIPARFRDRLVTMHVPGMEAGAGNDTPENVRALIANWWPPLEHAVTAVGDRYLRLHDEQPGLVVFLVSQGGQAILGVEALTQLKRRFKHARFYGYTHLPEHDELRERVPGIVAEYRQAGLEGMVVADNLHPDTLLNDYGMMASLTGFLAAAQQADTPVEINNVLRLLFANAPDGLVSYATWTTSLPGHAFLPHPKVGPRHYVYADPLRAAILSGLEDVRRPEQHALGLDIADGRVVPRASIWDLVLAGVIPEDLKDDEDDVRSGMFRKHRVKRNYGLSFASIATAINPADIRCPVAVVALRPIPGGQATLASIAARPLLELGPVEPPPGVPVGELEPTIDSEKEVRDVA